MNEQQLKRMAEGKGFIAALDQSGGSTPKALKAYGVDESQYANEDEMFDLVHQMRTRIIKSPAFTSEHILGAILFEQTMDREIDGQKTGDYLWDVKGIVPFLKIDKGLAAETDGVQLMKPNPGLDDLLDRANERHIFGTKMRSVINQANPEGIRQIVDQQFELAERIVANDLVPIIEPEVNIKSADKAESEKILLAEIEKHLKTWPEDKPVMFKLSIPTVVDFYEPLMKTKGVTRVVALSGGYSREEANRLLAQNHGLIASFSRALSEGLTASQTDDEFNTLMATSINAIYEASIT